jgi:hypothetical protein
VVSRNWIRQWRAPHESEQIDEAKRGALIANIRQAVRSKSDDIEVEG